jgi:hypothetical protein
MGILKHLLFWPVTGPTFLARFSMEKVQETVRGELTDDQRIKEELLALQMELELGEVTDEEYTAREADLMRQLREVREWREEFGMGVAGGPVRVASSKTKGEQGSKTDDKTSGTASLGGAAIEISIDRDSSPD